MILDKLWFPYWEILLQYIVAALPTNWNHLFRFSSIFQKVSNSIIPFMNHIQQQWLIYVWWQFPHQLNHKVYFKCSLSLTDTEHFDHSKICPQFCCIDFLTWSTWFLTTIFSIVIKIFCIWKAEFVVLMKIRNRLHKCCNV